MLKDTPPTEMSGSGTPTFARSVCTDGKRAKDFSITVRAGVDENPNALIARLAATLKERDATILMIMIYGDCSVRDEVTKLLRRHLGAIDWPVIWSEGGGCGVSPLAGIQVFAFEGVIADLQRIMVGGHVVASSYSDGDARHCLLGGVGPTNPELSRAQQANETFQNLETALANAGFSLADVARTWFYNDDILAWYDDFNRVRTSYYSRRPFRMGSLPASTAVSGRNPQGAALTLGAWAVQPLTPAARVVELASPLQCPAPQYGSSFSRAVEIVSGGRQRILVSGTASIEPGGKTAWVGDIRKQVDLTMDVVEAILRSRGLGFGDVTRALAYCKDPRYASVFADWVARRGIDSFPYTPVHCVICRDDLLWEIELDACTDLS